MKFKLKSSAESCCKQTVGDLEYGTHFKAKGCSHTYTIIKMYFGMSLILEEHLSPETCPVYVWETNMVNWLQASCGVSEIIPPENVEIIP